MQPFFITGTGTNVGKTMVSAILAEALQADYWKPVQAGYSDGTDTEWVQSMISNNLSSVFPETYKLGMPASPHIAAREEGIKISLDRIVTDYNRIYNSSRPLIIEGAGGLMVPLNEQELVIDLIKKLNARVIIVSRNYLGSINHSLLTSEVCKTNDIRVTGWIFNDQYLNYEQEIANWSGYPVLGSVPYTAQVNKQFISEQAAHLQKSLC